MDIHMQLAQCCTYRFFFSLKIVWRFGGILSRLYRRQLLVQSF